MKASSQSIRLQALCLIAEAQLVGGGCQLCGGDEWKKKSYASGKDLKCYIKDRAGPPPPQGLVLGASRRLDKAKHSTRLHFDHRVTYAPMWACKGRLGHGAYDVGAKSPGPPYSRDTYSLPLLACHGICPRQAWWAFWIGVCGVWEPLNHGFCVKTCDLVDLASASKSSEQVLSVSSALQHKASNGSVKLATL
eukprot:1084655-Pelagomonas_calceolata.AAC.2